MYTRRAALLSTAACFASLPALSAAPLKFAGTWTGVLNLGSTRLRVRLAINANGVVALYSIDQDNQPIAGSASADGCKLKIELKSIGATFVGRLAGADRIDGTWQQNVELPLTIFRGEQGLNDPVVPLTQAGLAALLRRCDAPSLAAAASRGGASPKIWMAGRRSVGAAPRIQETDFWHLGSITKSMTATLVARLVEAGMASWDLRVGDVLGDVAPEMNAGYAAATFRHLLSHRAGLPADLSQLQLASFALGDAREIRAQRQRYARLALEMEPAGPVESNYLYSNNGYVVAAAMLEALLGSSWEDLIQAHVFEPLGLASAGFGPPDAGLVGPLRQPVGHTADLDAKLLKLFGASGIRPLRPGLGEITDNPRVLGPAGRVHMSLADLLKYLDAHREQSGFLRRESWLTLHTPPFGGDYALGWVVRPDGTRWHNGSNSFWYAEVQFNSARAVSTASVCNEDRVAATMAVGTALLRAEAAAISA